MKIHGNAGMVCLDKPCWTGKSFCTPNCVPLCLDGSIFLLNRIQMHDTTMIFLQEAYLMWSFLGELSSALNMSHVLTRYVGDKSPKRFKALGPPKRTTSLLWQSSLLLVVVVVPSTSLPGTKAIRRLCYEASYGGVHVGPATLTS